VTKKAKSSSPCWSLAFMCDSNSNAHSGAYTNITKKACAFETLFQDNGTSSAWLGLRLCKACTWEQMQNVSQDLDLTSNRLYFLGDKRVFPWEKRKKRIEIVMICVFVCCARLLRLLHRYLNSRVWTTEEEAAASKRRVFVTLKLAHVSNFTSTLRYTVYSTFGSITWTSDLQQV